MARIDLGAGITVLRGIFSSVGTGDFKRDFSDLRSGDWCYLDRSRSFKLRVSASIVCGICIALIGNVCSAKEKIILQAQTAKMDRLPPPKVLQGSVGQSVMFNIPVRPTNVLGFSQSGADYPKTITYVRPGSLAWGAGLQAGDKILEEHATDVLAGMIVQRLKKQYFCMLDLTKATSSKETAGKGAEKAENKDAKRLSSRAIVMMVDDSASMGTLDCPGKKSRWQWCREHIQDMYKESNGLLQSNISIVTFDSNFRSYRNCSPSKLTDVFNSLTPEGETNMAPALDEAFSLVRSQLERGQPALVSLISDGRPTDVDAVKKSITTEVNKLSHPELLSIVFIEVGTPEHYLHELDEDLVKQGAAKDVVSVIPFGSVSSQSLTITLSTAVAKADESLQAKGLLSGKVSSENAAKKAIDSHIGSPSTVPAQKPPPPVKPAPVVAKPPIKAHPSGTSADGKVQTVKVEVKPVEVDEKESVLKHAANKTY
jgi:uncharacterized protein YegL